jgi:putative flippase GtrA
MKTETAAKRRTSIPPPPRLVCKFLYKYKQLIHEFFRYVFVGALAFTVDFGILYLSKTFLFSRTGISGILFATACGFLGGLFTNYILSSIFVFKKTSESAKRNKVRSFLIFTLICLTSLGLTELLMYIGVRIAGEREYLFIKCFIAGIVLIWNYVSKKIFVFERRTPW